MQKLAEQYCPVLWLHPEEPYLPCSIEYLLRSSDIFVGDKQNAVAAVSAVPNVQVMTLAANNTPDAFLSVRPEFWGGQSITGIPKNVPCYAHIVLNDTEYRITYCFLYGYNGAYQLFGCPGTVCEAGAHKYDLEQLTVYVDRVSGSITRVYMGAHGHKDGIYVAAEDLWFDNGRPVAFVAKGGHGLYPEPKTYWRIFGAANDQCAQGIRWDPSVVLIDESTVWNSWLGSWEALGDGDPPLRHWWWDNDASIQTNCVKRFFAC